MTPALLSRIQETAWQRAEHLASKGIAPATPAECSAAIELYNFVSRFRCEAHVTTAAPEDRARLFELVAITGGVPGSSLSPDGEAFCVASSLAAQLRKPPGRTALEQHVRKTGGWL